MGLEGGTIVSKHGKSTVVTRPGYINDDVRNTRKSISTTRTRDARRSYDSSYGGWVLSVWWSRDRPRTDIILSERSHHDESTRIAIDNGAVRYYLDYKDRHEAPKHKSWLTDGYQFNYQTKHGAHVHGYMEFEGGEGFYQTVEFASGDLENISTAMTIKLLKANGFSKMATADGSDSLAMTAKSFYGDFGDHVGQDRQGSWTTPIIFS